MDQYAPDEQMRSEPHASPLGGDLGGWPPVTIVAAEIDPVGERRPGLREKLRAAGVTVSHRLYKGVTHEFFGMGAVIDEAGKAVEFAAMDLRKALAADGRAGPGTAAGSNLRSMPGHIDIGGRRRLHTR